MLLNGDGSHTELSWVPNDPFPDEDGSDQGDPACSDDHVYGALLPTDPAHPAVWPCETDPSRSCHRFVFKNRAQDRNSRDSTLDIVVDYARALPTGLTTDPWRPYRCNRHINEPFGFSVGPTFLAEAQMTIDARRQPFGPLAQPGASDPYWRQTGYDGSYTCNWIERDGHYDVEFSGVRKYDQSAPPGYAEADAFCATGWPQGPADHLDRNVPHWYRIAIDTYMEPLSDRLEEQGRARIDLDLYGAGWKPRRFDFFNPNSNKWFNPLGARINNVFVDWEAVSPDASGCSTTHTYRVRLTPGADGNPRIPTYSPGAGDTLVPSSVAAEAGAPLLFNLWDFWEFQNWDNCGLLQVGVGEVDPATGLAVGSPYAAPQTAAPSQTSCRWDPPDAARQAFILDDAGNEPGSLDYTKPWRCEDSTGEPGAGIDSGNLAVFGNPGYPACFWPETVAAVGVPANGNAAAVTTTIGWVNDSTVHSITSWCAPLGESTPAPVTDADGDGVDDSGCSGTVFDSNPACPRSSNLDPTRCLSKGDRLTCTVGVAAQLGGQDTLGVRCTSSEFAGQQTKPLPAALYDPADPPADGLVSIPWFCRVTPTMRGTLVVSTVGGAIQGA